MTGRDAGLAAARVVLPLVALVLGAAADAQAQCRVSVDASVKRSKVPVGRLSAADFTIADNGVPQKVETVAIDAEEAVPVES